VRSAFTTVAGAGSLADGSAAAPSVAFASDVNTGLFRAGSDALAFTTGGTERAQFDASGRLLVGTSTSVSVLGENKVQLFGENSGGSLSLTRTGATTQSANLVFGRTRGDASTRVSLNNDDVVGRIYFVGDDGTDIQTPAALIQVNVDGTPGANRHARQDRTEHDCDWGEFSDGADEDYKWWSVRNQYDGLQLWQIYWQVTSSPGNRQRIY
jgi:hypothetical protein